MAGRTCPLDAVKSDDGQTGRLLRRHHRLGRRGGHQPHGRIAATSRPIPIRGGRALAYPACAPSSRTKSSSMARTIEDEFLFVIACNPKFTAKGMKMAPRAEIGDGKIDVVMVRHASRLQMMKLFFKVFDGSHVSMDCVEYQQVRSFAIESEGRELPGPRWRNERPDAFPCGTPACGALRLRLEPELEVCFRRFPG